MGDELEQTKTLLFRSGCMRVAFLCDGPARDPVHGKRMRSRDEQADCVWLGVFETHCAFPDWCATVSVALQEAAYVFVRRCVYGYKLGWMSGDA